MPTSPLVLTVGIRCRYKAGNAVAPYEMVLTL